MRGTSVRVVRPSASNAAAIVLRTLFFAPVTRTTPARRAPPTTRNLSGPFGLALNTRGSPSTGPGDAEPAELGHGGIVGAPMIVGPVGSAAWSTSRAST